MDIRGGDIETRARDELFINVQPIQAAGRLTPEAMKAMISYGDGYSTCDWCMSPWRLDKIERPPIQEFHFNLADFLGMDEVRVVPGARRGFQAVASTLVEKNDVVLVSDLAHYTEFLAVEQAGGVLREIPSNEDNIVTGKAAEEKIEKVEREEKKRPKLIIIDHFDYSFANKHEVRQIAEVAKDYDIPVLCNGAYSVGVAPVDGKNLGVDFLVGSGHKSFASPAPSGILATTDRWTDEVFRSTDAKGDVSGRTFGVKEVEMLGCTLMGSNIIAMMASFPHVKKRVKRWEEELDKASYFLKEFLKIEGNKILSEMPRNHTLVKVDTTESFDRVAKDHKRRGYFLYEELKERGIIGIFAGATRRWKLNTYGLTWNQIEHLSESFKDIAKKYDLPVNE